MKRKALVGVVSDDEETIDMIRRDPEFGMLYLRTALAEIDEPAGEAIFLKALRQVIEARGGMTEVARKAGLSRESLYRALSARGNPTLRTLHRVINAAGLRFSDLTRPA